MEIGLHTPASSSTDCAIGFDTGAITTKRNIRQTVRTRCEETFWKKLEIVPAALHNDAGIIDPATLALESEFRQGVQGRPG
ncbi:MAG: hypothetical protein JO251_12245 [Verrucomicrobia bacterium]|nr:hypothetical protein [Verrucomicrobiota bacterium]